MLVGKPPLTGAKPMESKPEDGSTFRFDKHYNVRADDTTTDLRSTATTTASKATATRERIDAYISLRFYYTRDAREQIDAYTRARKNGSCA